MLATNGSDTNVLKSQPTYGQTETKCDPKGRMPLHPTLLPRLLTFILSKISQGPLKLSVKVKRVGGENCEFRHNRASNA